MHQTLSLGGAVAFIAVCLYATFKTGISRQATQYLLTAAALLFFGFSAFTVAQEGMLAVWTEHTRNFWANQIWFDLLCAFAVGWCLLLPRAKAQGMNTVL